MKDSITIRRATPDDIPSLNNLVNSGYRGEGSKQGWTTEADLLEGIRTTEESLLQMMKKPEATIILAEESGNLTGCVYLEKQDDALYLGMLTVKPNLQGKGLGAQLMEVAEQKAIEEGCTKMKITVITVRDELIAFYKRKGYVDTGRRHPFVLGEHFGTPKQSLEFMEMEKTLV